ncbi:MAG: formylglycine-generating enzyme family protein [Anaerolineales bacterium]|jgi:formylglycine-generating enzyme required for sulfatase activity
MMRRRYSLAILFLSLTLGVTSCASRRAQIVDEFDVPMALVPAGEFKLSGWSKVSDQGIVEPVYLDDFYIDIYEVTNQDYAECVVEGVCAEPKNSTYYGDAPYQDHPVIFVTWDMAQTFCDWRGARLPTKLEWEKAARDELEKVNYYWGDVSPVCQVGARLGKGIDENADFRTSTQPVGNSSPNALGLYDMTGNVWEWVQDPYINDDYKILPSTVSFLRMSTWSGYGPVYQRFLCGFRCARSP